MERETERFAEALFATWETSGRRDAMIGDLATELFGRAAVVQDEITRARRALAEADSALLDVLAAMGIPSRPVAATPFRPRRE